MVSDASADPDWKDNPDMKLGMKAYLGYPVEWPDGEIFGTICVLDRKSRDFSDRRVRILEEFRSLVQAHLELLYKNTQLDEKIRELNELNTLYIKREERILKLKKEVNDLLVSSGKPIRYKSV
jgi:GAF domain-containing protein